MADNEKTYDEIVEELRAMVSEEATDEDVPAQDPEADIWGDE